MMSAMIAITTSNSTSVKPGRKRIRLMKCPDWFDGFEFIIKSIFHILGTS